MMKLLRLLTLTLLMMLSTSALASWNQYLEAFDQAHFSGAGIYQSDGRMLSTTGKLDIGPQKAQQLFEGLASDKPFKGGVTIAGTRYRFVEGARDRMVGAAGGEQILVYRTSKTLVVVVTRPDTRLNSAQTEINSTIRSLRQAGK